MNNLNIEKSKTSFAGFKVKQQNIFGLALMDTRNFVNSGKVSGEFWEAIGGKMSKSMDYKVGTTIFWYRGTFANISRRNVKDLSALRALLVGGT